ncbi:Sfi1p Ecym_8277 [Eremothecium cymbalariae DBVPG|uniref:Sfi1 spindle body domain-containing protein n=1 Tax=Eremothecium cymbalariae (strain CBS 270.75 / DBVPG 7215 / KCTC 17166 / NRRL Y-17582) TaxID=931890 RepID=G8JXI5_ERECY|nr:Hypothetical protein Ecym_8277 [Eremothecium cymbalariae DBVPG\
MDDSGPSTESDVTALPDLSCSGTLEDYGSSTNDLISRDVYHSTGSLIHKSIHELMRDLRLSKNIGRYFEPSLQGHAGPEYIYWDDRFLYDNTNMLKNDIVSPIFDAEGDEENSFQPGNEEDPVIQGVFNLIQVFLLRHGLSFDFVKIFERYVKLLKESDVDPLKDQYLLAIQNALSESYEFTPVMDAIVTAFLMKPENVPMKLALMEHRHQILVLKKWFFSWRLKWSINTNLHDCEGIWNNYFLKKYLNKWSEKHKLVSEYWPEDSVNANSFRLTSLAFDLWTNKYTISQTKKKMADNFHLLTFFTRIKDVSAKMKTLDYKAKTLHSHSLISRYFLIWKLKLRNQNCKPTIGNLIQRMMLSKIEKKFMDIKELENFGSFAENSLLLRPLILKWKLKLKHHESRVQKLESLQASFIKKRAYDTWRKMFEYRERESLARVTLDNNIIKFFFQKIWSRRFSERTVLYQVVATKNEVILKSILAQWQKICVLKLKADVVYNKTVFKKTIKYMVSTSKLKKMQKLKKEQLLKNGLGFWKTRYQEEQHIKSFNRKVVERYWDHELKRKYLAFDDLLYITELSYHSNLVKSTFAYWRRKQIEKVELNEKAVIYLKLKAAQKLKRAISKTELVNFRERHFAGIASEIYIQRYFQLWHKNAIIRKGLRLEILLESFRRSQSYTIARSYLSNWKSKWEFYSRECNNIARKKTKRDLGKWLLTKFADQIELRRLWMDQADNLRISMLVLNCFMSWLERMDAIQKLSSLVQLKVEERDVNLVVKCLSRWNMKTLKFRRNQETGQMFRGRWNRALLRYIITLWKDKTEKMPKPKPNDLFKTNNDVSSGFMTPLKLDRITIPGSERMMKNKMERIKNRYRGARRAIPSPIKSSNVLGSSIKRKLSTMVNTNQPHDDAYEDDHTMTPVPKLNILQEGKKYNSSVKNLDFSRIPELDPFSVREPQNHNIPFTIGRAVLSDDTYIIDESPTKAKGRKSPLN